MNAEVDFRNTWQYFLRSNYPELAANPKRDHQLWHASYVQTYLEACHSVLK